MRDAALQSFIDAVDASFKAHLSQHAAIASLHTNIFGSAAESIGDSGQHAPEQQTVCKHLPNALATAKDGSREVAALADAIKELEPRATWRRRIPSDADPSGFAEAHANATIIGQGGIEERNDIRIGISLVAPNTVYPNHTHPPEEMYVALSDSAWRNADTDWIRPGIGGYFHNPPGIVHAMRSTSTPLLAVWCLWSAS